MDNRKFFLQLGVFHRILRLVPVLGLLLVLVPLGARAASTPASSSFNYQAPMTGNSVSAGLLGFAMNGAAVEEVQWQLVLDQSSAPPLQLLATLTFAAVGGTFDATSNTVTLGNASGPFQGTAVLTDGQGHAALTSGAVTGQIDNGAVTFQFTGSGTKDAPQASSTLQASWQFGDGDTFAGQATGQFFFPSAIWQTLVKNDASPVFWYLTRAAAIIAYLLLTASTIFGLAISTRRWDAVIARWRVFDLHKLLSLLMVGFIGLHLGSLALDHYLAFSVLNLFVPFTTTYRPLWVALGIIGLYLLLAVWVSSLLQRRLRYRTWRGLHYLSFAAFPLVTLHGLLAGTNGSQFWMFLMYIVSGTGVVLLILARGERFNRGKAPPRPVSQRAPTAVS